MLYKRYTESRYKEHWDANMLADYCLAIMSNLFPEQFYSEKRIKRNFPCTKCTMKIKDFAFTANNAVQ